MEDTNSLYLCGRVLSDPQLDHTLYSQSFYTFNAGVERLSGTTDTLPVTLPERAVESLPRTGDRLHIHGQLRSYNRCVDNGSRLIVTAFARSCYHADDDEQDANEVTLSGYLCKSAQVRKTPFGREITDILLAVNRLYGKADYLPIIAWGGNAYTAAELPVGAHIYITGRLQSREYKKTFDNGETVQRTAYEVSAGSIQII